MKSVDYTVGTRPLTHVILITEGGGGEGGGVLSPAKWPLFDPQLSGSIVFPVATWKCVENCQKIIIDKNINTSPDNLFPHTLTRN